MIQPHSQRHTHRYSQCYGDGLASAEARALEWNGVEWNGVRGEEVRTGEVGDRVDPAHLRQSAKLRSAWNQAAHGTWPPAGAHQHD